MQQKVPNPDEVAKLKVGGSDFQYFESVFVQVHFAEAFDYFRFTAADPSGMNFDTQQDCEVELGGETAVTGIVTVIQVAYDAQSHHVQIQGKSNTWLAARGAILNIPQYGYENTTFQDIATKVLQPFSKKAPIFNGVDSAPYDIMHPHPGENVWSFLERIARQKGIICGVDQQGNFQFTGKLQSNKLGTLEEGKNILRMQYVKSCEALFSEYVFKVQSRADDEQNMRKAAAPQTPPLKGSLKKYSPTYFPHENASYPLDELNKRGKNEHDWAEGSVVTAIVTVQGWKSDGGSLWKPGGTVSINSKMCGINGVDMAIQNATFTQDNNSGTLTILECVPPQQLKGESEFNFSPVAPGPPVQPPGGQ